jgi:hypothetical protein
MDALEALANENIPFVVKGRATYEQQIAAIRNTPSTLSSSAMLYQPWSKAA